MMQAWPLAYPMDFNQIMFWQQQNMKFMPDGNPFNG